MEVGAMHNRRRSSRLKSLEDKKDRDDGDYEEANGADNEEPTAAAGSEHTMPQASHHSGHSSKDRSHKSKLKKSKKHKEKDKEKRKERKKSRSLKEASNANRSESSSEENGSSRKAMDGKTVNGDRHANLSTMDCFTPPLPPTLAAVNLKAATPNPLATANMCTNRTGNSSDSSQSPKPEKLKHRWRRNSELESGHKLHDHHHSHTSPAMHNFNSDASEGSPDSSNAKHPLGPYNAQNGSPTLPSASYVASSSSLVQPIPKETLPIPPFDRIDENIYLYDR